MNAVAPGSAAGQHHQVSRFLFAREGQVLRYQPYRTAVDQRVGCIALVEEDGAVERRYAQPVAVVGYAGTDALEDAPGMEHCRRQPVIGQIGRAETEDVGVGYRLGA